MTLRKGFGAELALPHGSDLRLDLAGVMIRDSSSNVRGGLFPPTPSAGLLTSTATMNVSVAAFSGVAVRDGGPVFIANDGPTNVLLANPPGSNSRLDVIYAKQDDNSSYVVSPDADNLPVFGVLTGIPSGSPVRNPAGLPAGALELGTVLVPSTATNTGSAGVVITPTFQYTCGANGQIWVRTVTELRALTTYPQGTEAFELDTGVEWQYYAAFNASSNPGGALTAGWYPVNGGPRARVTKNITQNGSTALVAVSWSSTGADWDRWGMFSTASNTRLTAPIDGLYRVRAVLGTNGTIARTLQARLNGSGTSLPTLANVGAAGAASSVFYELDVPMTAGDYLELMVQDASAGLAISTSSSYFSLEYIEPRSAI